MKQHLRVSHKILHFADVFSAFCAGVCSLVLGSRLNFNNSNLNGVTKYFVADMTSSMAGSHNDINGRHENAVNVLTYLKGL